MTSNPFVSKGTRFETITTKEGVEVMTTTFQVEGSFFLSKNI